MRIALAALIILAAAAAAAEPPPEAKSHVGNLHPFLQRLAEAQPRKLAYVPGDWKSPEEWRAAGRAKMRELLAYEPEHESLAPEILSETSEPGYTRYLVRYSVAAGRRTEAFLLIPEGLKGPAPAVLALHDHGGFYYFGKEKITKTENPPPVLQKHIDTAYGGRPFADELARQGFVVLVPDAFYFGSQRLRLEELPEQFTEPARGLAPGADDYIAAFNKIANTHETIVAKTIFASGATWPGILFQGDRASVDYLLTRPEVDAARIGCLGLSIGGFRAAHLFGLDPRVKAGVVAGWMTTYGSLLFDHLQFHTWMIYVPGQLAWLDLPDAAALNAPRPLLVVNCLQDVLFTPEGMREADRRIASVYSAMGKPERFKCSYYDEPHSFKVPAQDEAIAWLKTWLDGGAAPID